MSQIIIKLDSAWVLECSMDDMLPTDVIAAFIRDNQIGSVLKKDFTELNAPIVVYGPFDAPIYKSKGVYRKRLIVKCKLNGRIRAVFGKLYEDFTRDQSRTHVSVDFNPTNL